MELLDHTIFFDAIKNKIEQGGDNIGENSKIYNDENSAKLELLNLKLFDSDPSRYNFLIDISDRRFCEFTARIIAERSYTLIVYSCDLATGNSHGFNYNIYELPCVIHHANGEYSCAIVNYKKLCLNNDKNDKEEITLFGKSHDKIYIERKYAFILHENIPNPFSLPPK